MIGWTEFVPRKGFFFFFFIFCFVVVANTLLWMQRKFCTTKRHFYDLSKTKSQRLHSTEFANFQCRPFHLESPLFEWNKQNREIWKTKANKNPLVSLNEFSIFTIDGETKTSEENRKNVCSTWWNKKWIEFKHFFLALSFALFRVNHIYGVHFRVKVTVNDKDKRQTIEQVNRGVRSYLKNILWFIDIEIAEAETKHWLKKEGKNEIDNFCFLLNFTLLTSATCKKGTKLIVWQKTVNNKKSACDLCMEKAETKQNKCSRKCFSLYWRSRSVVNFSFQFWTISNSIGLKMVGKYWSNRWVSHDANLNISRFDFYEYWQRASSLIFAWHWHFWFVEMHKTIEVLFLWPSSSSFFYCLILYFIFVSLTATHK